MVAVRPFLGLAQWAGWIECAETEQPGQLEWVGRVEWAERAEKLGEDNSTRRLHLARSNPHIAAS